MRNRGGEGCVAALGMTKGALGTAKSRGISRDFVTRVISGKVGRQAP
jgi:hypothetical protein